MSRFATTMKRIREAELKNIRQDAAVKMPAAKASTPVLRPFAPLLSFRQPSSNKWELSLLTLKIFLEEAVC